MSTRILDRIMDGARTPEGKVIAVLLAVCLSLMSWNVTALGYAVGGDGAVAGEQEAAEQKEALKEASAEKAEKAVAATEKATAPAAEPAAAAGSAAEPSAPAAGSAAEPAAPAAAPAAEPATDTANEEPAESSAAGADAAPADTTAGEAAQAGPSGDGSEAGTDPAAAEGDGDEATEPEEGPAAEPNEGLAAAEPEEGVEYPSAELYANAGGTIVKVTAEEGALPEGTTVAAKDVTSDAIAKQVEASTGDVLGDFKAIDVTLYGPGGDELQPLKPVNVTFFDADLESDDVSVYHIADSGKVDEVDAIQADADVQSFETSSFSVFVIDASMPIATYMFYDGNNELVDTQKVRNGNVLHAPATPEYDKGMQFLGWYDGNDQKLEFDASGQLIANVTETATYTYTAKIVTSITVTFYDQGANPAVLAVKQVDASAKVSTDNVVVTPADVSQAFVGWATQQGADEAAYAAGESIANITESLSLYPVIKSAHWITFNENDNNNLDSNATYIAPVFVLSGAQPIAPAKPKRPGYVFTGWYTDQECSSENEFDFNGELTTDIVLYAGWEPGDTTYTVVFWKQKITDKKEVTDYTKKSYDYEASLTVDAKTGSDVSVQDEYKGYDGLASVEIGDNTYDFTGFKYSHCSEGATVAGDGSTVLNVYYDRKLMTIELATSRKTVTEYVSCGTVGSAELKASSHEGQVKLNGYWRDAYVQVGGKYYRLMSDDLSKATDLYYKTSSTSGATRYKVTNSIEVFAAVDTTVMASGVTMTGLYGQTLASNGWTWPSDRYKDITFLDAFQGSWFDDNEDNTLFSTYKYTSGTDTTVNHYKENGDGTWPSSPTNSTKESNSSSSFQFLFTAKYNGYTVKDYRINGGAWKNAKEGAKSDTVAKGGTLDIRYALNDYNIDFRNDARSAKTESYAYGKSLKDVGNWAPECPYPDPEQYTFVGWFADPECTVYVFFGEEDAAKKDKLEHDEEASAFTTIETMPAGNFAVYAKWERTWYNVQLDTNGGKLANGQYDTFWLQYGDTVNNGKPFSSAQINRDGYTLAGWQIASGAAGEHNYNDKAGAPWNFASGVQGNLNLKAVWKGDINTFKLQYKVDGVVTQDSHDYAAGAQAPVSGPSVTAPTGKVFLGWRVASDADAGGADQATFPNGGLITLSEDISDKDGVVTLVPAFGDSPIATTDIRFYANYPNGTDTSKISKAIENNGNYTLPSANELGFNAEGYSFLGWTTEKTATYSSGAEGSYAANTLVGVNTEEEPNELYAQWVINKYKITFVDDDGTTVLKDATEYNYGTAADNIVQPDVPTKAATAQYTYTFSGWTPEVAEVTGDATYTATYSSTVNTYTVTWKNEDGTVLETDENVEYGTTPSYDGDTPTKAADDWRTYEFSGWSPAIAEVSSNATYVATYTASDRVYNITYDLAGGSLETGKTNPTQYTPASDDFTLNNPAKVGYVFAGWTGSNSENPETKVTVAKGSTGDKEYKANWTPRNDVEYKVNHYLENLSGNGYTLEDTETKEGTTGQEVEATSKEFPGFAFDTTVSGTKLTGTVVGDGSLELNLYYTRNTYTVSYEYEKAPGTAPELPAESEYKYGAAVSLADGVELAGYTFTGWYVQDGSTPIQKSSDNTFKMPAGDVVLCGQLTANTNTAYTVQHWQQNIDDDEYTLVSADTAAKAGTTDTTATAIWKSYPGFHSNTMKSISKGLIVGDGSLVLKLYYDRDSVTVTYTDGVEGEEVFADKEDTVRYGAETPTAPGNPSREGYTFEGWNPEPESIATADATYKAQWEPVVYSIAYYLDGGALEGSASNPTSYTIESENITLANPAREGHTFAGWTGTDLEAATVDVTIPKGSTGDRSYTAAWTVNSYNVTYKYEGDVPDSAPNTIADGQSEYGTTVALAGQPVLAGYTFSGWASEDVEIAKDATSFVMPAKDVTLKGSWQANNNTSYSVQHYYQDAVGDGYKLGSTENLKGTTGNTVAATPLTIEKGLPSYLKYNADKSAGTNSGAIAGDGSLVLKLYYDRNVHNVTYKYAEGSPASAPVPVGVANYRYGATVSLEGDPTLDGYSFEGWASNDATLTDGARSFEMPDTDVSVVGSWEPVEYNLTYDLAGGALEGSASNPTSYTIESENITLANPAREGYTFAGWTGTDLDTATVDVTIPKGSTGDRSYTAAWTVNSYNVTYRYADGTPNAASALPDGQTVEYGKEVIVADPATLAGYDFDGWQVVRGNAQVSDGKFTMPSSDVTFEGSFTARTDTTYSVRHLKQNAENDDYTLADTDSNLQGTTGGLTNAQSKDYDGFNVQDFEQQAIDGNGDTVIDIYYNRNVHSVTYEYAEGSPASAPDPVGVANYRYGATVSLEGDPTLDGYSFEGWASNDATLTDGARSFEMPDKDVRVVGSWKAVQYDLTYDLAGGALEEGASNPGSYTIESENITLANPAREGYTFAGWTGTGLDAATTDVTIPTGSTGDRSYTATWAPIVYSISYNLDGGMNAASNPESYTIESDTITLADPTRTGYEFVGWTEGSTIEKGSTGDKAFTAQWRIIGYEISYNLAGGTNAAGNPTYYNVESENITLAEPQRTGYTFHGWTGTGLDTASKVVTIPTGSTGNRSYTATWSVNSYKVSYTYNGTVPNGADPATAPNDVDYQFGSSVAKATVTAPDGYTFSGWTTTSPGVGDGESFSMPSNDVAFEGSFSAKKDTQYVVEFYYMNNNGRYPDVPNKKEVRQGTTDTLASASDADQVPSVSAVADADHFVLDNGASKLSDNINGDGSTMLKVYFAKRFTVTYEPGSHAAAGNDTIIHSALDAGSQTPLGPEYVGASGYTFGDWSPQRNDVVNSDVTYVAQWNANNDTPYEIQYYFQDPVTGEYPQNAKDTITRRGKTDTMASVTSGDKTTSALGYVFDEDNTNNKLSTNINGAGDAVLKVYFKLSYTVSFEPGNHSSGDVAAVSHQNLDWGATTPQPPAFQPAEGYERAQQEWNENIEPDVTSNATYIAQWAPIAYNVNYELNGGENVVSNPYSYTVEDGDRALAQPTREGYRFVGWTGSNGNVPETRVTIPTGSTGERSYTANWEANFDDIKLVIDGDDSNPGLVGFTTVYDGRPHSVKVVGTLDGDIVSFRDGDNTIDGSTYELKDATANGHMVTVVVARGDERFEKEIEAVVSPRPVKLTSQSGSKPYDGTPLSMPGVTVSTDDGTDGYYAFVSGEAYDWKAAGENGDPVLVTSAPVKNKITFTKAASYKDSNYALTLIEGDLTVTDATDPGADPTKPNPTVDPKNVVTKTHAGSTAASGKFDEGDAITFTVTVKNIYDAPKTVTLQEKPGVLFGEGDGASNIEVLELAAGETKSVVATYTVSAGDILAGEFDNTVSAGFEGKAFEADDKVSDISDPNPQVAIAKTTESKPADGNAYALGETISYNVKVSNVGNVELTNIVVNDDLYGDNAIDQSWTIPALAIGADVTFEYTHVVTEEDVLRGKVFNEATLASATTPEGVETEPKQDPDTDNDTEDPIQTPKPSIYVNKVAVNADGSQLDPDVTFGEGEEVTYQITVGNNGNVTVNDIEVADELTGDAYTVTLEPGSRDTRTVTYTVQQSDILSGKVVNNVTASGTDPEGGKPEDNGEATVKTVPVNRDLVVEKTVVGEQVEYAVGSTVNYNIAVTNAGNVDMHNVSVTDQLVNAQGNAELTVPQGTALQPDGTAIIETLPVGQTVDIAASYVVQEGDAGKAIANSAAVSAKGADNPTDTDDPSDPEKNPDINVTDQTAGEQVENLYELSVRYVYADGSQAAPTYTANLAAGSSFEVASPTIDGFTPDFAAIVSGQDGMPARDLSLVVTYTQNPVPATPDDESEVTDDGTGTTTTATANANRARNAGRTAAPAGAPAAPAAATAAATATAPTGVVNIDEDGNPLVESIDDDDNALASGLDGEGAGQGGWALLNLLATLLAVALAAYMLVGLFGRKNDEAETGDAEGTEAADGSWTMAEDEQAAVAKRHRMLRLASIVPAVAAIVALLLTQDFSQPMIMVDAWTVLFAIAAVANVALLVASRKTQEDVAGDDGGNPTPAMA